MRQPTPAPTQPSAWSAPGPSVFTRDRYFTPKRNGLSGTQNAATKRAAREALGKLFNKRMRAAADKAAA